MYRATGGFRFSWSLCLIFKPFTRSFPNGWCWLAHWLCVLEDSSIKCRPLSLLSTPFPSLFSCSVGLHFCYSPLSFLSTFLFSQLFSLSPLSHLLPCCCSFPHCLSALLMLSLLISPQHLASQLLPISTPREIQAWGN